jgi:hypothetical protein
MDECRRCRSEVVQAIREVAPEVNAQTVFSEDILETWPAREAFLLLASLADPIDPVTHRDWIGYRRPDSDGKGWKAPKRHASVYRHLRRGGLLSADRLRAIAAEDVSTLGGTGRGEVHRRAVRLRDLLEGVGEGHDVPETVARVLDPDRWIEGEGPEVELARQDIERLRTEANRILDEAEEPLPLVGLVARVRNRIASREPLGLDATPDIKIVTLWGREGPYR